MIGYARRLRNTNAALPRRVVAVFPELRWNGGRTAPDADLPRRRSAQPLRRRLLVPAAYAAAMIAGWLVGSRIADLLLRLLAHAGR